MRYDTPLVQLVFTQSGAEADPRHDSSHSQLKVRGQLSLSVRRSFYEMEYCSKLGLLSKLA